MEDLVIPIHEYIGDSCWNWETDTYERASNCDDLRYAVAYAGYANQPFDRIVLEIGNCYGGSVNEGLAMFHYLQELGVPIKTRILGTVASMGTVLPLCGDEIEVAQTAQFMVHAPSNEMWGTAAQISADLKGLQDTTASLATVYEARTGQDAATVAGWMSKDTWFTAAEALAAGLCTAVVPLAPKAVAPPTEAQARIQRTRFAEAVARADKRTTPAKTPAAPAPIPAPMTKVAKPIAAAVKPVPRAASKPTARKTLFTQLKELFNGIEEEEDESTAEGGDETTTAEMQSTELDNGAFLYHDGALAVDSKVFNDEAMTEATPDGDYDTKDSQVITVAAGIVTAIEPNADASAATADATAKLTQRFDQLEAALKTEQAKSAKLETEVAALKKIKPAMPQARGARPNADAPDPKTPAAPKAVAAHHAGL